MAAIVTQPLPPAANGRRRLREARWSGLVASAAATRRRSLLSSNNFITITPLTIPLTTANGLVYFEYDSFSGSPSSADVISYDLGDDYDGAFTVLGNGIGTNCVSSAINPPGTVCPPGDSFSFTLNYLSPRPQEEIFSPLLNLSFVPASGSQGPVVETYVFQDTATPFYITTNDSNHDVAYTRRRLLQVQPPHSTCPGVAMLIG